jgi:hypothetical protein
MSCDSCKLMQEVIKAKDDVIESLRQQIANLNMLPNVYPKLPQPYIPIPNTWENDWYSRCPCNPANGGSGICGCVRPGQVTYSGVTLNS